ncbi:MAG: prephenate dehydrogenase [Butyricicoccaceae bacterium]
MFDTVLIAGLGLMGGSMAKTIKARTLSRVLGWNRTRATAEQALADGSIDAIATEALYKEADLVIIGLYPQATVDWLLENMPKMKKGCVIVDMVGVKQFMVDHLEQAALDAGVHYVGGHPMAGREFSGLDYSLPTLFDGASMIFVPTRSSNERVLEQLRRTHVAGFARRALHRAAARSHDRVYLAAGACGFLGVHQSPEADKHNGYSAGSYKDLTRVARLNETMWSELFLCNAEPLAQEIDEIIKHLDEYRKVIRAGDREELTILLRDGRERKERLG